MVDSNYTNGDQMFQRCSNKIPKDEREIKVDLDGFTLHQIKTLGLSSDHFMITTRLKKDKRAHGVQRHIEFDYS